jgi:phage-related protein
MAIIGSAYVIVKAITTGFERDVKKAIKDMSPGFERSGEDAAKPFSRGFRAGLSDQLKNIDPVKGLKDNFTAAGERSGKSFGRGFKAGAADALSNFDPLRGSSQSFKDSGAKAGQVFSKSFASTIKSEMAAFAPSMGQHGDRAGRSFAEGFKKRLRADLANFDPMRGTGDVHRAAGSSAAGAFSADFKKQIKAALKELDDEFEKAGQRHGKRYLTGINAIAQQIQQGIGRAFTPRGSAFSRKGGAFGIDFRKLEAEANRAYDVFFRMITTGYLIGPVIGYLVSGISSLVSGFVALAAQASAALPSLIVLPSIFTAIGQAAIVAKMAFGGIGNALKQMGKTGGGGGGSDKRVENAEKNLARVLEQNRENLARASDRLAEAEDRLTRARKDAAESLQQLNFDAEDAAISEKRAAIELEKARETLARVQDLPPNSRARREAELAYAEADLNLRRAKDRNSDLAKETEEANKKGVEGSDQVVEATKALKDAIDDKAKTERDALRSQIDAEEQLADARKGGGGGGATQAFDNLSKSAQDFAKYLFSLKPKLNELKEAAADSLLPPLTFAIDTLVQKMFPSLIPMIEKTGAALGKSAIDFANIATKGENLKKLDAVFDTNARTVGKLGEFVGYLYDGFLSLLTAADPLIERFTTWAVEVAKGWSETRQANLESGKLEETFRKAGDVAAQLGTIFGNIVEALGNIGRAASGPGSGGQLLLDSFEDATEKFAEFTKKLLEDGSLRQFFIDTSKNAQAVMSMLTMLVKEFLKLGDNQAITDTSNSIKNFIPAIGDIFRVFTDAAPAVGEFFGELVETLKIFTESESIENFFGVLTKILDVLNNIFSNPVVNKILLTTAAFLGIVKALSLAQKVAFFAFKVFASYPIKLFNMVMSTAGAFQSLGAVLGVSTGAALGIVAAIGAVIAAIVLAYQNSEKFREAVKKLVDAVFVKLKKAFDSIKDTLENVFKKFGAGKDSVEGFKNMFEKLGDILAKIVPYIKTYVIGVIEQVESTIKAVINVIAGIIKVFQGVWHFVQGIFALFKGDWDGVKEHFGAGLTAIKDAFMFVFSAFKDAFHAVVVVPIKTAWEIGIKPVWDAILTVFKEVWEAIKTVFTGIWDGIKEAVGLGWQAIKLYFEAIKTAFKTVWDGIKIIFDTVWGAITGAVSFGVGLITGAFDLIKTAFSTVFETLAGIAESAFSSVVSVITGIVNGVISAVEKAVNMAIRGINFVIRGYNKIPLAPNISEIGEVTLGRVGQSAQAAGAGAASLMGRLLDAAGVRLALGGVVSPSPGGTLAVIGEAGRSERVEPLDPDGLSRRDKEMIKYLSGGEGGRPITMNIYPSAGMDEKELASMISRQLAFQLRKGAA